MQFYVAAGMGETLPRGRFRPVRAAYRLGPRLLSAIGTAAIKGGLMLVEDSSECVDAETLARDILRECLTREYDGIVLDWRRRGPDRGALTARIGQLCAQYRRRMFVPEPYAAYAARSTVLVNTAVSGGTLNACLDEAVRRYGAARIALDLERLRLDFTLPHSANIRRALTASELRKLREGKAVYFPRSYAPGISPTGAEAKTTTCCLTMRRPCAPKRQPRRTGGSGKASSCCRRWRTSPGNCWGKREAAQDTGEKSKKITTRKGW